MVAVTSSGTAVVTLPADDQILITREFAARPDQVYEGAPDAEAVNTLTLDEIDGRTRMTVLVQHTSQKHRDMHINSGMEGGMQESLYLLEEIAVSLR